MDLPAKLAARWEAAHTELEHAEMNHRRPGFSDELGELVDRLAAAHHGLADVYAELANVPNLPAPLAAAAHTAAQHHQEAADA